MIKLLLVEDDVNLSYMIRGSLEDMIGGYEVITAYNGLDGIELWKKHKPDIIIADIEMPEMNGFEMVEKIRAVDGDTLIFFASGRISPNDVTGGYKLGANNYVKKPFVPEELDAHIKSQIKLKNKLRAKNESQIQKIGVYSFDAINGTLKDADGGRIPLTSTESKILELLVMNRGETIKREDILEKFWDVEGKDYFASRRLDTFITALRKKMPDPSVKIETVRGIGVRLNS